MPSREAPEVRLLGQPLPLDDHAVTRALERVRRYAGRQIGLRMPSGKVREYFPGRLGVGIDKVRLTQLVRDARDPTSPLRRGWQDSGHKGPLDLPVPMVVDAGRAVPAFLLLKDELDRLPRDARLDLEKHQLVHEIPGRLLDVDASVAALEAALESGKHRRPWSSSTRSRGASPRSSAT